MLIKQTIFCGIRTQPLEDANCVLWTRCWWSPLHVASLGTCAGVGLCVGGATLVLLAGFAAASARRVTVAFNSALV